MTEFDPIFWTALLKIIDVNIILSGDNAVALLELPWLKLIGSVLLLWIVITIGAALSGWVAGEMAWNEAVIKSFTSQFPPWFEYLAALVGAVVVIAVGKWLAGRLAATS